MAECLNSGKSPLQPPLAALVDKKFVVAFGKNRGRYYRPAKT